MAAILCAAAVLTAGCGSTGYDMAYKLNNDVSSFQLAGTAASQETLTPFASDLCVAGERDITTAGISLPEAGAAALFDQKSLETLYAKNVNEQLNPASLTKVMTALRTLRHGSPDQMLTASENVKITESGATLCGLNPGDQMTMDQALHILLLQSANDVAVMIAEGVAGSVDAFVALMNEEAARIGATNSSFTNPNGLTEDGHYMTAYDMYLIFQEALQYELFNQIIQMSTYTTTYRDRNGGEKTLDLKNSNRYLRGTWELPDNVTVIGGKTGTTNAAGSCLVLLSKGSDGTPYISVILKASSGAPYTVSGVDESRRKAVDRGLEAAEAEDENIRKVYLTFDDGPSSNTGRILDILAEYDVKATFFVVGKEEEEYQPLYKRIVEEGHTLAMHSYSHKYNEIYQSVESYRDDLSRLQEFLYDTTGVWCRYCRFPGGSSNQVSKVDMHDLIAYLDGQDISYFDWNVSSGDASSDYVSPGSIVRNSTSQLQKFKEAIILMHDASEKKSTVEALPELIETIQAMEDTKIVPINDDTEPIHHISND